jgi:hypothetical protein
MKKIVKERKFTSKSNAHCCTISDISAVGWVGTPNPPNRTALFLKMLFGFEIMFRKLKFLLKTIEK